MKLNELFEIYIEDIVMSKQPTTVDSIKYRYNSAIRPIFGDQLLESISVKDIKKYQKELSKGIYRARNGKVFTPSYINIIIDLLKRIMKYGILMSYFSPTSEQSRGLTCIYPLIENDFGKKSQVIWTIQDFNKFSEIIDEKKYEVFFNVLFYTGLRRGEAISLTWNDVDLINQSITVNSTACKVVGRGQVVKAPKSSSSNRIIYINDSLNEMLLGFFFILKEKYGTSINHLFVFGGTKMISFTTLDRVFKKYKDIADVSDMNLHGFRHSHATLLLELNNDIYNISKRLGHDNIEITDTYLHVNDKIQKEIATKIEKALNYEQHNNINDYLVGLKNDLKKQMIKSNFKSEDIHTLKTIYDFINSF